MKGCLRIVRGNEVKLVLPGPSITEKSDGTLWMSGRPILGIEDPAEKTRFAGLARAGEYDQIPAQYFTRLGNNPNGLWAGTDEAWANHPAKLAADNAAKLKAAKAAKQVTIYLSSRGWGDYSACEWRGDITRPDADILAECRTLLVSEHDVDKPNQSDADLLAKIQVARSDWQAAPARKAAREAEEAEDIKRKIASGYCFACETYCHGDCGHYSRDPRKMYSRQFRAAAQEANYGIND